MSAFRNIFSGVDLDSIFAARINAPGIVTGYRNNDGQDLNQRYEPYNGANPSGPVGYRIADGRDLSQLFSTTAGIPRNFNISGEAFNPVNGSTASATFAFDTTGLINGSAATSGSVSNSSWFTLPRAGLGNDYDVMVSNRSAGTWTGTAYDTWHRLNIGRSFTFQRTGNGTSTGTATAYVRRASDGVIVATGPISLSATVGSV